MLLTGKNPTISDKKLQQRYVLAKRIKKLSLRALITFLYVLSYNLLMQSWFCICWHQSTVENCDRKTVVELLMCYVSDKLCCLSTVCTCTWISIPNSIRSSSYLIKNTAPCTDNYWSSTCLFLFWKVFCGKLPLLQLFLFSYIGVMYYVM